MGCSDNLSEGDYHLPVLLLLRQALRLPVSLSSPGPLSWLRDGGLGFWVSVVGAARPGRHLRQHVREEEASPLPRPPPPRPAPGTPHPPTLHCQPSWPL